VFERGSDQCKLGELHALVVCIRSEGFDNRPQTAGFFVEREDVTGSHIRGFSDKFLKYLLVCHGFSFLWVKKDGCVFVEEGDHQGTKSPGN
jgi:hypothetical protein